MPRFPLEYTLCHFQSGNISLAVRTHRREGRNPELDISVGPGHVMFTLPDLLDGIPQTLLGDPRDNHVDFYFLLDEFRRSRSTFPTVATPPDRRNSATDGGPERDGEAWWKADPNESRWANLSDARRGSCD